jgi:DNA-binding response OmpR family regulator
VTRLLIVDDEPRITDFLERGFRKHGFTTMLAKDGETALALADDKYFDLMILDLGLPDLDGITVLTAVRRAGNKLPIIVLTARHQTEAIVTSFEQGADDYVSKPFSFDELLARVRVRLLGTRQGQLTVLTVGSISLDARTRRATVGVVEVDLTAREYALADAFLRHPGQVLSREQLLSQVWGYDFDPGSNVVEVYIRYLRRKLGQHTIETVRGMGYRLALP